MASTLLALALAGCGDEPVQVDVPRLSAEDAAACEALVADLPDLLGDHDRRLVSPAAAPGAAWGEPAIVLRCGAPLPDGLDELSPCLEANGVGWLVPEEAMDDPDDGQDASDVTIAAAGYEPAVTVTIPGEYRPEAVTSVTAGLASTVKDNLRAGKPCV